MPYPDIKVYVAFCKGVPVYYEEKKDSSITTELVYEHVVPKTQNNYCQSVSIVFGRVLL